MEGTIGEIRMFGGDFAPRSWAFCSGQLMSIQANSALFAILGTRFGGDGRSNFGIPDLQGRMPVGAGNGRGLTPRLLGQPGGVEQVRLDISQLPTHTHTADVAGPMSANLAVSSANATSSSPTSGQSIAAPNVASGRSTSPVQGFNSSAPDTLLNSGSIQFGSATLPIQVGQTGMDNGHDNMPPFLGINFIICLEGIFPSRN